MKKILLITISILLISPLYAEKVKKKVKLPAGTIVTIKTLQPLSSKKKSLAICAVNADIWDESGEFIIIKEGTPADVQVFIQGASIFGEAGSVTFQPISTAAFNGRLVGFDKQQVVFSGSDYLFQRRVKLPAGTSFRAYTANDLYFTIEVEEVVEE